MKISLGTPRVLTMTSMLMLLIFLVDTIEAAEIETCPDFNLPSWINWRTPEAKTARERLTDDWLRTSAVVIAAILVVLANVHLCYLLFSNMWEQQAYNGMQ